MKPIEATPQNELRIRNRDGACRLDGSLLRRIALALLNEEPIREAGCANLRYELGVHLVGGPRIARLNARHLNHTGPTDVITFDYGPPVGAAKHESWLVGDIFICPEVAWHQARQFRATFQSELVRYLVHGLLHLRGYDDLDTVCRRAMKREENRLARMVENRFALGELARFCLLVPPQAE